MRILALVMAFYIGFLTSQPMSSPASDFIAQQFEKKDQHSCCEKKQESKSQKKNSCENQCPGICNPFGQGSCCLYTNATPLSLEVAIILSDLNSSTSANLLSNYLADCFHPPEVI
jgi:hypothetical protein